MDDEASNDVGLQHLDERLTNQADNPIHFAFGEVLVKTLRARLNSSRATWGPRASVCHLGHINGLTHVCGSRTYYLSKLILWWCKPPAFPRPPGCFLCLPVGIQHIFRCGGFIRSDDGKDGSNLPTRPCPWLTCPRSFLVLDFLVGCQRRHGRRLINHHW